MASTSKVYEGRRTIDGLVVTVDGNRLDEHYEVKRFTTFGFELALAILVEHLGDNQRAINLVEPFMKNVVANLDNDWRLTGGEIDEALAALK
jgi:Family of unknown function (DUF6166)